MSNELSTNEVDEALGAADVAYTAASVAQDQAVKLRGHIDWLTEQLAERDERIESLEQEVEDRNGLIDVLNAEIEDLSHPERA